MTTERDAESEAPAWLPTVAALLAIGSSLLLVGGLAGISSGAAAVPRFGEPGFVIFYVFTLVAVAIHAVAWVVVYRGLAALQAMDSEKAEKLQRAFGYSIWATVACAIVVPLPFIGIWLVAYTILLPFIALFIVYYLPYIPLVFAPAVLFHAYLFSHVSSRQPAQDGTLLRQAAATAGVLFLVAITAVGVSSQIAYSTGLYSSQTIAVATFIPVPAGLTAVGYWLAFAAFRPARGHRVSSPDSSVEESPGVVKG